MSRSKAKGTAAETAVVRFLRTAGFVQAERRTLAGVQDRGDIAGIPGVVIEVKNCARQELPAWVGEAEIERDNDRATLGVVWHKRRGKGDPGDWFVTMSGHQFAALLREQQGLPTPTAADAQQDEAGPCAQHPHAPTFGGMCGGCTQYPSDFPARLAPMDPVHILGVEAADEERSA